MYFISSIFIFVTIFSIAAQKSSLEYINPLIGTGGHGHTFPGVTVPFGLVQLSPDTDDTGWDWCSGYHYQDNSIMGFSHTHLSGTGISDLADILIMPYVGKIQLHPGDKQGTGEGYRSNFSHAEEVSEPGYYAVRLKKHNILAELTAAHHIGMHQYTFPDTDSARVIIDLLHGLDRHRSWLTERVLESSLQLIDSCTISGYRISSGWANVQPVYFQIRFSKPFREYGMALHDVFRPGANMMRGRHVKGVFTFSMEEGEKLEIIVQISDGPFKDKPFIMASFDELKNKAKALWRFEMDKIDIEASDTVKQIFYTALYHSAMAPNKLNSKNIEDNAPQDNYADEYGTLSQWDTYRAAFALNTLIRPEVVNGMMGTMLRTTLKNGYLPVWKLWHDEVHCMIGTPSVPIIVEAAVKGYGLDRLTEIKDAIVMTMTNDNPVAPWSLLDRYGYIPVNSGEMFTVSKTLEMTYASACARDFMLYFFPSEQKIIQNLDNRAKYYKNVFDASIGFFRGKDDDGNWVSPFDPTVTAEASFVEATPWQYLFHAHHDVNGMVELQGGRVGFIRKLDSLFLAGQGKIDKHILDITGLMGQYAHGNEPCHHVAYLYNAVGQPWKTQERVYDILTTMYSTQTDGLCGNEDCGQMSAWYIFSSLGFYPLHPSSGRYALGIPIVKKAVLELGNGKKLKVITKRVETTENNKNLSWRYIREVSWNGKKLEIPEISHTQIMEGGTLEFILSQTPVYGAFRN